MAGAARPARLDFARDRVGRRNGPGMPAEVEAGLWLQRPGGAAALQRRVKRVELAAASRRAEHVDGPAGGAGFTPSATGIIVDHFGDARDRAVSLFGSIFPIGAMIGPIFGGLFVTYWSWRAVFFVNVPIGLAIIVLALRYIPRDGPRPREIPGDMDATGMALLGAGLLAGMLAASYLGDGRTHVWSPAFLVAVVTSIVAIRAFWNHIGRRSDPFIAPQLISGPGFGSVNLVNASYGGVANGVVTLIPLYAANRYGIDALGSGTLLIASMP